MPIFLLPEMARALLKLSGRLAGWDRLARIEEQLLRRARSAFLVRWFGTAVPEKNLNLLIYIDNIAELSDRYALAERSRKRDSRGLNLFGPMAGLVGVTAGLVFNPTGGTLIATLMRLFDGGFSRNGFSAIFAEIVYRLFIEHGSVPFWVSAAGFLILLIAPAMALGVGLSAGMGGEPRVRAVYNLLGDVAEMLDAFLRFWRNLTGPVDQIRNPLVKAMVQLLNRIAALFIQVFGFAALLVVRLVPLLPSLVAQFLALGELGRTVADIVGQMFAGILDTIKQPFLARGGIKAILLGILDRLTDLPSLLLDVLTSYFNNAVTVITDAYNHMQAMLSTFIDELKGRIIDAFHTTPIGALWVRIQALLLIVPRVTLAFETMPGPPPAPPTPPTRPWYRRALSAVGDAAVWVGTEAADNLYLGNILEGIDDTMAAVDRLPFPSFPTISRPPIPVLPDLPNIAALEADLGGRPALGLEGMRDALMTDARRHAAEQPLPPELLRNPRSAFAAERRRLEAMGPEISQRESQLRDLIYAALGRVLPPALRDLAPTVRGMFDQFDHQVYGAPEPDPHAPEMPQLDLADSGRLRPKVRVLTIRSGSGIQADLRAFQTMLVEALRERRYYAPAG